MCGDDDAVTVATRCVMSSHYGDDNVASMGLANEERRRRISIIL